MTNDERPSQKPVGHLDDGTIVALENGSKEELIHPVSGPGYILDQWRSRVLTGVRRVLKGVASQALKPEGPDNKDTTDKDPHRFERTW